jgi:hypothetical protein
MSETQFRILTVDRIDGSRIVVEFSDKTHAVFTLNQLISLAPDRTNSDVPDMELG